MSAWDEARTRLVDPPRRVVTLCTGNVCRSPIAAGVLAARLAERDLGIRVDSAGTTALVGSGAMPEAVDAAAAQGADITQHIARQLDEPLASSADLILCATRAHRTHVLARFAHVDPDRVRLINEPIDDGETPLDVEDPYGFDADVYALVARVIAAAMDAWAARIERWAAPRQDG